MANHDLSARYQRFLQYFWDPEPRNDDPAHPPVWCLGSRYEACTPTTAGSHSDQADQTYVEVQQVDTDEKAPATVSGSPPWPKAFLDDFEAKFWFTYRSEFPAIPRAQGSKAAAALTLSVRLRNIGEATGFTSDSGWGCMIRSGQCLIGNALANLRLGREWRSGQRTDQERELVAMFADHPKAPFSIHRFVEYGASACGKHPGEWFGPSATAQCIEALSREYPETGLSVYIAHDGAQIYEGNVFNLAKKGSEFLPVLILAGIRLGIDRVTPVYRQALQGILHLKQSVGIAGGRPSASHYFVAVQGESFFYLDPHYTRPALPYHINNDSYTDIEISTCHTRRLRRLHIDKMDPSMLIAFLIKSQDEWEAWKDSVSQLPGSPILNIIQGEAPEDSMNDDQDAMAEVEAFDDF